MSINWVLEVEKNGCAAILGRAIFWGIGCDEGFSGVLLGFGGFGGCSVVRGVLAGTRECPVDEGYVGMLVGIGVVGWHTVDMRNRKD